MGGCITYYEPDLFDLFNPYYTLTPDLFRLSINSTFNTTCITSMSTTDIPFDMPYTEITSVAMDIIGEINFHTDNMDRYRWKPEIKEKKRKQRRKW